MKISFKDFVDKGEKFSDIQIKKLGVVMPKKTIELQQSRDTFRNLIRYLVAEYGLEAIIDTNSISYKEAGYVRAGKKDDEITRKFHFDENTLPLMKKFALCVKSLEENGKAERGTIDSYYFVFLGKSEEFIKDINTAVEPLSIDDSGISILITCANCNNIFEKAPRCPECGQLILYKNN